MKTVQAEALGHGPNEFVSIIRSSPKKDFQLRARFVFHGSDGIKVHPKNGSPSFRVEILRRGK